MKNALGLTVLVVDADLDLVAQVTGRRVETLDDEWERAGGAARRHSGAWALAARSQPSP